MIIHSLILIAGCMSLCEHCKHTIWEDDMERHYYYLNELQGISYCGIALFLSLPRRVINLLSAFKWFLPVYVINHCFDVNSANHELCNTTEFIIMYDVHTSAIINESPTKWWTLSCTSVLERFYNGNVSRLWKLQSCPLWP